MGQSKHSSLKNIKKGEIIKVQMLAFKRPGIGLSPEMSKKLIGKKAKQNIEKDSLILIKNLS